MPFNCIIYEKEAGIGKITLNRPQQANSLSNELITEMSQVISQIGKDDEVRVVIICGGDRFFCAGADLKEVTGIKSGQEAYVFLSSVSGSFDELEKLKKPVIAAINGLALGGGLELALACDFRICSTTAALGISEISLALIPGGGGTQRLPRIIGTTKAMEMLLIGDPITAEEAYRVGLVNTVVPPEKLMEEVNRVASVLMSKSSVALGVAKSVIIEGMDMSLDSALEFERRSASFLFTTEDQKEGVRAFIEKRKPTFIGK